jgi:hypothetical protein
MGSQKVPQRRESNVEPHPIAILEAVHHSSRWCGHSHRHTLDLVGLVPLLHQPVYGVSQLKRRVIELGRMGSARHTNPHRVGLLRGEVVECERRPQVDHALRSSQGHFDEGVMLADLSLGMHVESPPHTQKLPTLDESREHHPRNAQRIELPSANGALLACQLKNALGLGRG